MSTYAEHPPAPALVSWVDCYWSVVGTEAVGASRILPDGCADLIVDLGASGVAERGNPVVIGVMRRAAVVTLARRVELFGVRFRAGRALGFLDVPLHELTDRRVPLDALWGALAGELAESLAAVGPAARPARADEILLRRRASGRARQRALEQDEALVARAVELVRRARGGVGVRETAAALGVGERRLERAYDRCVGLSPKALARVVRLRGVLRAMRAAPAPSLSWSTLAHEAGYADQPHLVREFRALVGATPAAWAAEQQRRGRGVGFLQDGAAGAR